MSHTLKTEKPNMITQVTKKATNSIVSGDKGSKFHIWNGSRTLCNRRSNNTESKADFIQNAKKYPSDACAKCLSKLSILK